MCVCLCRQRDRDSVRVRDGLDGKSAQPAGSHQADQDEVHDLHLRTRRQTLRHPRHAAEVRLHQNTLTVVAQSQHQLLIISIRLFSVN